MGPWDSSGYYHYNYSSDKRLASYDGYQRTGYGWGKFETQKYFYNSTSDFLDSVIYTNPNGSFNGMRQYFRNSLGLADSMIEYNQRAFYRKVKYFYTKGILMNLDIYYYDIPNIPPSQSHHFTRDSLSRVVSDSTLPDTAVESYFYDSLGHIKIILTALYNTQTGSPKWDTFSRTYYKYSPDSSSGIPLIIASPIPLSIYPNPFTGVFRIQANSFHENVTIFIMDITGRISWIQEVSSKKLREGYYLHPDNIPSGIYILNCTDGLRQGRSKIVKE